MSDQEKNITNADEPQKAQKVSLSNLVILQRYGGQNTIPLVKESCDMEEFENAIRKIGVVNACEWFGHAKEDEWTLDTVKTLCERSGVAV